MSRLPDSDESVLTQIKLKANQNAKEMGTYGTRAIFEPGKTVAPFSQECERLINTRRGVRY